MHCIVLSSEALPASLSFLDLSPQSRFPDRHPRITSTSSSSRRIHLLPYVRVNPQPRMDLLHNANKILAPMCS